MVNCNKKIWGNSSIALKQIRNQKHKLQNRVESTRAHQLNSTFRWPGKSKPEHEAQPEPPECPLSWSQSSELRCVQWAVAPAYVRFTGTFSLNWLSENLALST